MNGSRAGRRSDPSPLDVSQYGVDIDGFGRRPRVLPQNPQPLHRLAQERVTPHCVFKACDLVVVGLTGNASGDQSPVQRATEELAWFGFVVVSHVVGHSGSASGKLVSLTAKSVEPPTPIGSIARRDAAQEHTRQAQDTLSRPAEGDGNVCF